MCEESSQSKENVSGISREIIPGYSSMEQFTKDGFKVLMEAIKHSNALPSGRELNFYSTSESFNKIINDEGSDLSRLINHVMRCNEIGSNLRNKVLDEKVELIVEANDVILEKVANNIDELNGIHKAGAAPVVIQTVSAQLPVNGSWNRPSAATFTVNSTVNESRGNNCIKLITAKNIVRPQKFFKDHIDNRNNYPWCPRIADKSNSLKPLAIFLEECDERQEYSHPYEYELDRFAPTADQLHEEEPKLPKSLSETDLIEINKPEELDELVETLRSCKMFAVDVEHHSYRSFMGITCLLQISTQEKDYMIDPLALRDKLCILNEVFTKNSIVKIFHGADKDIEWLQRDLSIYVVNMFDTHQAAKALQYQGLSLSFLMKKFCNVLPNKQFQLADWRMRPLPEELKKYAREDTHYLIYIYQMLKNELLLKANKSDNLLKSVIERSTEICKKRYFKPILLEDSHMETYRKCKKLFNNRQLYALKEIYAWRDKLAREEDESVAYVLPTHMLMQISEALPREMQGILACCNPIPPLVRSHLLELHQIVLKARDQPLEKAIMKDTTGPGVLKTVSKVNVDSVLHCPHDVSKSQEFRDDLPTLLNNDKFKSEIKNVANRKLSIEKRSSYSVFSDSQDIDNVFNERETFKKLRGFAYFSPFERYKLVKPFVVAENEAEKAQKEESVKEEGGSQKEAVENTQERTDEERIASIRDHFVHLSRKFSEELQVQKQKEEEERRHEEASLIQLGGSRKRKRNADASYDAFKAAVAAPANHFHNPTPTLNNFNPRQGQKRKNRGKKRKFNEVGDNANEGQIPNVGGFNKRKKNKPSRQQPQRNQNVTNQPQEQNSQNQQNIHQPQNNQSRPMSKKKTQNINQGGSQVPQRVRNGQEQKNKPKKNKGNKNQNPNFVPYDYASVDFRQFQGGAGSASTGVQVKPNFKPKNRNRNRNKRGAKSATFGGNPRQNRGGGQQMNY